MGHSFIGEPLFKDPFVAPNEAESRPGELVTLFDDAFYERDELSDQFKVLCHQSLAIN